MFKKDNQGANMRNPFFIEGPASISFSGGRTSGYMLWKILEAHGGELPEDVVVCFANTGKEMPETLDFVADCAARWRVKINWIQYKEAENIEDRYEVVSYPTAARNGEPFEALIRRRGYLPNVVARYCTFDLKIRAMHRFLMADCGFESWTSVVGIRADEPRRVAKLNAKGNYTSREERIAPLATAGVTVAEVGEFWKNNDFDLYLPNMNGKTMHGNCDLCFLKASTQVISLVREVPARAEWWIKQERFARERGAKTGSRFRADHPSYEEIHRMATTQSELFEFGDESIEDCACTD